MRVLVALALLTLSGCTDEADPLPEPEPEPEPQPQPEPDLTGPLFDPLRVIDVSIELPAADWEALRKQTRSVSDVFGSCPTGPRSSPFTPFRATVTVDGQTLTDVGVRKKGFYGSLDEAKPSLKIKTDEYVMGQRLFGLKSLTLNNAKQDPSLIKQCLAYDVFARVGIPAPRCNYARVRVNNALLGIYVNIESVNKPFLRRHFEDDEGNLYEGAISDFRPGWTGTFDKKTNESQTDRSDLDAVTTALTRPDAELLGALDPLVDVEQFLGYWAAEVLIGHTDSYSGLANNFFVYDDPVSGKFNFLPWGVDNTFHDGGIVNADFSSVAANGLLARRLYLYTPTRDRYIAKLRAHLVGAWKESELLAEVDRMAALISAPSAEVEAVRVFVRGRRTQIIDELAAGPPVWSAPYKASAKPCFEQNGTFTATFQTTWGTLGAPDPFASGTGTLTATVDGSPLVNQRIGSAAGMGDTGPVVQVVAQHPDGTATIVWVAIEPAQFTAPNDVTMGSEGGVQAAAYRYTPSPESFAMLGFAFSGSLRLDAASQTTGAQVGGRVDFVTISSPF